MTDNLADVVVLKWYPLTIRTLKLLFQTTKGVVQFGDDIQAVIAVSNFSAVSQLSTLKTSAAAVRSSSISSPVSRFRSRFDGCREGLIDTAEKDDCNQDLKPV